MKKAEKRFKTLYARMAKLEREASNFVERVYEIVDDMQEEVQAIVLDIEE